MTVISENDKSLSISSCEQFLLEIGHIISLQRERARLSGENFNLFDILRVGHYEVSTHSPILADLMDPKGSHGQGTKFLDCFLRILGKKTDSKGILELPKVFESESATVEQERFIGRKTETSGGRIDIRIRDAAGRQIVIENKIYAVDQENWALRYAGTLRKEDILIYLTLDGRAMSGCDQRAIQKARDGSVRSVHLSYASDILTWLTDCQKEAALIPVVREGIEQYINLIRRLTFQNSNHLMSEDLIDLILKPGTENLRSFYALGGLGDKVSERILEKLNGDLRCKLRELNANRSESKISFDDEVTPSRDRYSGWQFSSDIFRAQNLVIGFEFGTGGWRDLCFGFCYVDKSRSCEMKDALLEELGSEFISSEYWPASTSFPVRNWDGEVFVEIAGSEAVADEMIRCISRLMDAFFLTLKRIGES